MELREVLQELDALERDGSLYVETSLEARAKALDLLAYAREIVRLRAKSEDLTLLERLVGSLQSRLEEVNEHLFERLRADIRAGRCTREGLRRQFDRYTDYTATDEGEAHIGYDGLDVLVDGLLLAGPQPRETRERTLEMVHYEATPARAILDLVDRVDLAPDDLFYDIGSGLGRVAILVHLLTGVRTKGVEFEPAFCAYARESARRLGLTDLEFIHADARDADYADGTVFFMFTPFRGATLQAVLDRLHQEAQQRSITICTYGPCTLHVSDQPWLVSADANADHEFKLAVFHGARSSVQCL